MRCDLDYHAIQRTRVFNCNYYKELFVLSEGPSFNVDVECWEQHEKVNNEEN
jgi:hypothetical protein